MLLSKQGVGITGVCGIHPARVGKSIFSLLGMESGDRNDVCVCTKALIRWIVCGRRVRYNIQQKQNE